MPDSGDAPAIYAALPKVSVDGTERAELSDGLRAMLVEETVDGIYRCELTVNNYGPKQGGLGYLLFDQQVIDFGKTLTIEAGAGDGRGKIFEGRVSGLEGRYFAERPPELLILAEDRLQDLRMTRRTRSFLNVSDSDIFNQVASAHSLTPQVDIASGQHDTVAQLNQSDLAFLREHARSIDAEIWVEGRNLHVQSRANRRGGTLTLSYGQGLHELSVLADLAGQVSGFQVTGWDVKGKQGISHRATDTTLAGELQGGQSGSAVLSRALGDRDQQLVHALAGTQTEAQALAEAHYRRTARRFVTGVGAAEGDARIRVGAQVELKALGALFDGKYQVVRATHLFDPTHGFRSQFAVERPGIGQ